MRLGENPCFPKDGPPKISVMRLPRIWMTGKAKNATKYYTTFPRGFKSVAKYFLMFWLPAKTLENTKAGSRASGPFRKIILDIDKPPCGGIELFICKVPTIHARTPTTPNAIQRAFRLPPSFRTSPNQVMKIPDITGLKIATLNR